jgi:ATP-dependent helicase/nuclease subunit A
MSARALKDADKQQRIAADPDTSVFVTANAGSGKTKVLVDRIARLLLLPNAKPSAFLCITYTKAAAAEMQRRLFERLGSWCVADDATLEAELTKLGASASDMGTARALFARALETPGGLRIQTIHAFCERLLARFPLEAGVSPGFDIADEARAAALLGEARASAALGAEAPAEAFLRFAARMNGDALDSFLDRLALRRADFHRFAQKHDNAVYAEAAIRNRHNVRQSAADFVRDFLARQDWRALREAAAALETGSAKDQDAAERLRAALDCMEHAPRDALTSCFKFALTDKGELRSAFATKKVKDDFPWIDSLLQRFGEDAADARAKLNAIERAEDAAAALQLAMTLDRAYERAKQRSGVLDFDDLIAHAQKLLQRADAAPWVLYKLDGGIDHILIDEGQDTSPTQWELIAPLQEEFFAGAGARERPRTVFAVGDPKQSIYAFQGADPERFLNEARVLEKRSRKAKQSFAAPELRTSFRSAPEVLRAVDAVFADPRRCLVAGEPGKHDEVVHLAAREQEGGVVEVWPLAMRPVAQPAVAWDAPMDVETGVTVHAQLSKAIAKRVKEMIDTREAVLDKDTRQMRPLRPGDVLALVRTRGAMFRELIKAFKRAGLPVAGADRMVLRDELAVEDCLALMRVALDPADDLALASVLKGPWVGLDDDDADIFPLAYGRERGETLMQRLNANTDEKYVFARAFVQELGIRAGADPFAFLSWALEAPHRDGRSGWDLVLSRLGAESRDPLEELLQRALKPSMMGAPTLQRFLYEIEVDSGQVKRELEAETGAVRVMTVHGAKGLEAPLVILPDSTGPSAAQPDDGLMFDDEKGPFISFRTGDDDAAVAAARQAHKDRMEGEHWRLLYVAMTRARDRLIVCGTQHGNSKDGETKESWRLAVQEALQGLSAAPVETPYGEGLRFGAPQIAEAEAVQTREAFALPDWTRKPAIGAVQRELAAPSRIKRIDPALFSPRGDGAKRFRRGRLIHGLLERLPDVAPARRVESAHAWLKRQGANAAEAEAYAREAIAVIDDPRFAAVFGAQSRAEAPIVGEAAGKAVSGVVDRLAVDGDRVIVLDFKTDRPAPANAADVPDAYVLQVALYREVLRQIFPGKRVTCALLWTEKPLLMELPDTRLDAVFEVFRRG